MKRLILFFMVLLPLQGAIAESIHCDSTIKLAVIDKYGGLPKYYDDGSLISENYKPKIFHTEFNRSGYFKLTFGVNTPDKIILNFDGKEASTIFERTNSSADKVNRKSLKSMFDGGAGVTHLLSTVIPPLLFGIRTVWSSPSVSTTYDVDTNEESIDECKVTFQYLSGTRKTYWIGPNMLINKVLIERPDSRGIKKRTINYHNIQME
ncbi:MAG: hypothetical protein P1U35_11790 [Cycloclasticus sp.]|jgi:hypothetical protein|nr:hypothetical protein [Cycloclasticus sp.]|tara:strand:- start:372 stop:992 length:621 start_codon:yes stop_codon:yes gene_type:complete